MEKTLFLYKGDFDFEFYVEEKNSPDGTIWIGQRV